MLEPSEELLLGTQVGNKYILNRDSAMVLEYMIKRLNEEDPTLRNYRRQLAFNQVIKTDLIPILINCGDREDVFATVIRLLVNLSVPMECLLPKEMTQTRTGKQTIYELTRNLTMTKEAFLDTNVSQVMMEHLAGYVIDKNKGLETSTIAIINNCLLLIRNVLHMSDVVLRFRQEESNRSAHNYILWNLFRNNMDDVLLDLMGHVNVGSWCNTIVQIIALIYKDQHVVNLQKLLQTFLDSTLSESSDNESNTSPQVEQEEGGSNPPDSSESSHVIENNNSSSSRGTNSTPSPPPSHDQNQPAEAFSIPGGQPRSPTLQSSNTNVDTGNGSNTNGTNPPSRQKTSKGSANSNLQDGEPPHKKYKEYWDNSSYYNESGVAEDKTSMEYTNSYSEADNISIKPKSGNQSGHSSESSDISGLPKTGKRQVNTTCSSDIGYVSQPCIQESTSSSSNDGDKRVRMVRTNPVVKHKTKPETNSNEEKQEIRRRKMMSLARQTRMRVKGMVNYAPTNEDISEILKEFTIDLLLTEYSGLVRKLLEVQRECKTETLDKSHILWLITYFLKFATQLEIGLGHIDSVLSVDTLSYVTYEGVEELEFFELAQRDRETELDPYLRRLHLVVAALREFMQTLAAYKQSTLLSQADKNHLFNLQLHSTYVKGLRQLLLLLIRSFNSVNNSLQYLTDLIVTNHYVLKNMEEAMQVEHYHAPKLDIQDHIRQFANMELMTKYGQLLVNFQENTPQVNDSIFTIMHHVAGDLESPHTLFIPAVLQTFSKILEEGINIVPDWVDLIEYVIQKFLHTMQNSPHKCAATITENMDNVEIVDECGLTPAEASSLFYHFNQVENHSDPVGAIIDIYRQAGNISLTRLSLIQSLLAHGIITHAQYMSFMYMKSVLAQCNGEGKGSVKAEVGSEHCTSDGHITDSEEAQEGIQRENREIKVLKDCLVKQGRGGLITWIQELLLDACRVKLYPNTVLPAASCVPHEPVAFHCNLTKQSIPLVPFSREQNLGLQTEAFILLLHKLGFLLPADVGKVYPRIPYFWSADHLYAVAAKLGPLPEDTYRFTSDDIERIARKANDPEKKPDSFCADTCMDGDAGFEDAATEPKQSVTDEPITGSQWKSRVNGNHLEDGVEQTVPIMTTTIASTESPMDVGVPVFTDVMSGTNYAHPRPTRLTRIPHNQQPRASSPAPSELCAQVFSNSASRGGLGGMSAPAGIKETAAMMVEKEKAMSMDEDEPMETLTENEYLDGLDLMDTSVKSARKTRF